jgi:uncharacterized protein VirK/YbjX
MTEIFDQFTLFQINESYLEVYKTFVGADSYECRLQNERVHPNEGELSLCFYFNNKFLYSLSFTFVPGSIFELKQRTAILISRMQGQEGAFDVIRAATRELHDVSPQHLLYAILQGIAKGAGVECVVGICSVNQLSFRAVKEAQLRKVYDEFFHAIKCRGPVNDFYIADVSETWLKKSLANVSHRSRVRKKRAFKQDIAQSIVSLQLPPPCHDVKTLNPCRNGPD